MFSRADGRREACVDLRARMAFPPIRADFERRARMASVPTPTVLLHASAAILSARSRRDESRSRESSRSGESHREPLLEPDVRLSPHPAPDIESSSEKGDDLALIGEVLPNAG
jgi:hypothetical protein